MSLVRVFVSKTDQPTRLEDRVSPDFFQCDFETKNLPDKCYNPYRSSYLTPLTKCSWILDPTVYTNHTHVVSWLPATPLNMAAVALGSVQLKLIFRPQIPAALITSELLLGFQAWSASLQPITITSKI